MPIKKNGQVSPTTEYFKSQKKKDQNNGTFNPIVENNNLHDYVNAS